MAVRKSRLAARPRVGIEYAMKVVIVLLCLVVGFLKLREVWQERQVERAYAAARLEEPADAAGFVEALPLTGVKPDVVTVFMPQNCPLPDGRRSQTLLEKIRAAGIPVSSSSSASAAINGSSAEEIAAKQEKMNRLMSGPVPIVFFKNRAKNNPSFDDVMLEFKITK